MSDDNQDQAEPESVMPETVTSIDPMTAKIIKLEAALADAKDAALRALAEAENVRKRTKKEIEDERRYGEGHLLSDLLPVIDNLSRAVASAEKQVDAAGLLQGVKLVMQQLDGVLNRHNTKRIDAMGKPFDPHLHQAIGHQPSPDHAADTVMLVAQDGYQLHDRVLRPSQVFVSSGAAAGAKQQTAQQQQAQD